ncbi:MAG: DUF3822 family protein [Alistipes sp.]|nr:DUF3822 family protein [Alistipes sp.]
MAKAELNKVSIRLESGGHTFSPAQCIEAAGAVEVVVSTFKTTLMPAELFAEDDAKHILTAVGCAPAVNESVVSSEPQEGIVAVMAISTACYDTLTAHYGARLRFTSPLMEAVDISDGMALHLDKDVLYVRIYGDGLRFAEAMEVSSDGDILYYLESINRVYDIYNMYARATGDTARIKRVAGRCFRNLEIVKVG